MTGAALARLSDRDCRHALLAAVAVFLPGPILACMATLASGRGRNTIRRPEGLDGLELSGPGAPDNRCKDQQNKNDSFHDIHLPYDRRLSTIATENPEKCL